MPLLSSFSNRTIKNTMYYQDGQLVAQEDDNNGAGRVKYYYHPDHLGSTDLVTDASGKIVEETT